MLEKIIPIILLFLLGGVLKKLKVLKKQDGDILLKFVFFLSIPAMAMNSMLDAVFNSSFLLIPLAAFLIMTGTYFCAKLAVRFIKMSQKQEGTFIIGAMIMNTGFILPFFTALFSNEEFVYVAIFDLSNIFLIFSFAYFVAVKYGSNSANSKQIAKKILIVPPLWGILIGLALNFFDITVGSTIINLLDLLGDTMTPLVMIALGLYFSPKISNIGKVSAVFLIRIGIGFSIGIFYLIIMKITGAAGAAILIGAAAPVGYNTFILSQLENLDTEFAATLVSFSLILGLVYVPLILLL